MRKRMIQIVGVFFILLILAIGFFIVGVRHMMGELGVSLADVSRVVNELSKPLPERVQLLLLGIGGEGHEGPLLTDTMLFVSLARNHAPVFISLPRDIWSDTLRDKLNTSYYYGETQNREGGGIGLTKQIVKEITGQEIERVIVVDFSLFKKSIDLIGGIDVVVDDAFSDPDYPIEGKENDRCDGDPRYRCRYQTVTFEKGIEHMDGERALMYVRSRHAQGDLGTDFSRGKRQQAVLEAIKKKIISADMVRHPEKFIALYRLAMNNIKTDSSFVELVSIGKLVYSTVSISPVYVSLETVLMNPNPKFYDNRYVLIPSIPVSEFQKYIEASISTPLR